MRDLLDEIEENIADAKEMVERSKPLLKGDLAAESTRRREARARVEDLQRQRSDKELWYE